MKLLKKTVFALSIALLVMSGSALLLPSSTRVSRFIVIDSDIESVFAMVNNHREFNKWSPWARRDPNTRYEFSGPESGVGAKMRWRSTNRKVGRGSREIVESMQNERVDIKLRFGRRGAAKASYFLVKEDGATKLTWIFFIDHGMKLVSRFFGPMLDTSVGADYEAGLQNLKVLLEGQTNG